MNARRSTVVVAVFATVVVVLWIRHRIHHEERVVRLTKLLEDARAKDEKRVAFLRRDPPRGDGPCNMHAMETARIFHPDSVVSRGAFMRETAAEIEEGREPRELSSWTYELDVLDDAKRAVLWDFTTDRALCGGPITGDDPRGGLVAF